MTTVASRRGSRSLVVLCVLLVTICASVGSAPAPVGAEPTGGCRPVGGGPVDPVGPHRATVVVDAGIGTVWSACVTFDGTISGLEALELAANTIPGLTPVYEPYAGQGRAVCRLLGVGNEPPNCLSKTVEYWSYFRNGQYARGGGSASVVADGDTEGWSFSRGTAPRAATAGTEAVASSAVPATTAPPPPTTVPPHDPPATGVPGVPGVPDSPGGPTDPGAGTPSTTTTGAAGPGAGDSAGGPSDGSHGSDSGEVQGDGVGTADGSDTTSTAPEPEGTGRAESVDDTSGTVTLRQSDDEGGSAVGSMVGFGGALGVAGFAAVLVRRRRHSAAAA